MKKKQLEKRVKFMQAFKSLSKKDKFQYIKDCPNQMINIISEACFNLLKLHSLKQDGKVKKKLKKIETCLNELSSSNKSVDVRRTLLLKEDIGTEIFALLSNVVLPTLEKLTKK